MRGVLWCLAIAYTACIVRLANRFQPLRLRTLVRHHVCQSLQRPLGLVELIVKLKIFIWNQVKVLGDLEVGAMTNKLGIGLQETIG